MITWIIGKNSNVDIIWHAYNNEIIKNLALLKSINLFEEKKYKYIYDKKDSLFFKNRTQKIKNEVVIKGVPKLDKELINEKEDMIFEADSQDSKKIFKFLIEVSKVSFEKEELFFINKLQFLEDVATIIILKKLSIPLDKWSYFTTEEKENWFKKLKENNLLIEGVINPNKIIPIMIYAINAKIKQKPNLLFLQGKINQGNQVWKYTKIWESCFKSLSNL